MKASPERDLPVRTFQGFHRRRIHLEFNEKQIEEYKELVVNRFMTKPLTKLREEFETDRLCWAFVMWTYRKLNIFIESEKRLRVLFENFKMLDEEDLPYRFPDIVVFRINPTLLERHAGIMIDEKRFVHMEKDQFGVQFTDLNKFPWCHLDKFVMRQK